MFLKNYSNIIQLLIQCKKKKSRNKVVIRMHFNKYILCLKMTKKRDKLIFYAVPITLYYEGLNGEC